MLWQFLRELHDAGVPWGVITNGGSTQRPKIASSGFGDIMPFAVVSGEVGYEKPDPRIYQEGLKLLGDVAAASTLFVGDYQIDHVDELRRGGPPHRPFARGLA